MSTNTPGLDDLLGGLLGGGGGGLDDLLGGLTGGGGESSLGQKTGGTGGLLAALLPMLGGMLAKGGLSKILSGLQQKGMADKADSWVSSGPNEPVSVDQVEELIDEQEISRIAERLGVSHEEAASAIAAVLPELVDRVSPEGQLPDEQDLDATFARLASASPA